MVDWEGEVKTREDLLVARIRQLDQRALDEARADENLERRTRTISMNIRDCAETENHNFMLGTLFFCIRERDSSHGFKREA